MKTSNTSERLKQLMRDRNLRQVDILNLTKPYCQKYSVKMNKSDISQYVSGKNEPSQEKLVILGMALNVSEPWLMGFDVPMIRNPEEIVADVMVNLLDGDPIVIELNNNIRSMTEKTKARLLRYSKLLLEEQEND